MTVRHSYFQTLSTDDFDGDIDVCWEQELPVGGGSVRVALWAGSDADLTAAALDAFAAFLARLNEADQAARAAIAAYLAEDGRTDSDGLQHRPRTLRPAFGGEIRFGRQDYRRRLGKLNRPRPVSSKSRALTSSAHPLSGSPNALFMRVQAAFGLRQSVPFPFGGAT